MLSDKNFRMMAEQFGNAKEDVSLPKTKSNIFQHQKKHKTPAYDS